MRSEPNYWATEPVDPNELSMVQQLPPQWQSRVLVVDDDEIVRAQLSTLLKRAGYKVKTAGSGVEAMRTLNAGNFQIMLTDWQMPGMDGIELCRSVRREHVRSYVYVMMLTVRQSKDDLLLSLAAGADDYVVKGSPIAELLARMEVARRITHLECSLRASNRENRRLSVTDPLTTAHNRRYLMKYLPRELSRAQRYARPLSVLCCDIDSFKEVNDHMGHDAGDRVLQEFVSRAKGCLRENSDWLARSGGDEFIVVMPETDRKGAITVAQKLGEVLIKPPLLIENRPLKVSVSIGITALETSTELAQTSVPQLLRSADRGLYANKRSRRVQGLSAMAAHS